LIFLVAIASFAIGSREISLRPLLSASWPIQLHVYTLVLAFLAGTVQFFLTRRGSSIHRILGRCFLGLMLVSALVTLRIHVNNPRGRFFGLSLLHLYVPLVVGLCVLAWFGAVRHRIRLHRFAVIALYFGSLIFTGYVQIFMANGIKHEMFFGTREVHRHQAALQTSPLSEEPSRQK
jgi:uncharacterized membrane protein